MVRLILSFVLAASLSRPAGALTTEAPRSSSATAAASALSPTAGEVSSEFPETPATPRWPKLEKNDPAGDFLVITVISLPFMALYSLAGAAAIAWYRSRTFPPPFDNSLITGAGALAAGASLTIAAVSVNWGGGQAKAAASGSPESLKKQTPVSKP